MNPLISPRYLMKLVKEVHDKLWDEYKSYREVEFYIDRWHEVWEDGYGFQSNFQIHRKGGGDIDLLRTLHTMDGVTLIKVAIDLGIATPDFIPLIPTFQNDLKSEYTTAYSTFEKSLKQVEEHPDLAIGLANSALESIIKEILKDKRINTRVKGNETLYALTSEILKVFQLFPDASVPIEIKTVGSSLIAAAQGVEKMRSTLTTLHGRTQGEYVLDNPLYASFIVNTVATIGIFLINYYKNKFPLQTEPNIGKPLDDLPF